MASITLNRKIISRSGDEIYVIAEIGQNHQGSLEIAKQLIWHAKKSGCDCVKFQKSDLPSKFTKSALNRVYNGKNSFGENYGTHKQHLEFSYKEYQELQRYCHGIGIDFSASAMDEKSLDFLHTLNLPFIKIGSGDCNNFPLLEKASKLPDTLIISTGMQSISTIEKVEEIMRRENKSNFAFLHCVSSYPTEADDCNLRVICLLKSKFPNVVIGYSGHELGLDTTKAAVILGARIIERHFTLNRHQKGSDHFCSLEPQDMTKLINDINELKQKDIHNEICTKNENILMLLNEKRQLLKSEEISLLCALKPADVKEIFQCELACREKLGKSIVAANDLKCGAIIDEHSIMIKVSEPPGIWAEEYYNIIGCKLVQNVRKDEPINTADICKNLSD